MDVIEVSTRLHEALHDEEVRAAGQITSIKRKKTKNLSEVTSARQGYP